MALTDNIVGYWKLDESSGNASDSVGSITLTNNNTVTYSSAIINNGANPDSTGSKHLKNSGSCPLTYAQMTGAQSYSFWVKRTITGALGMYFMTYNSNGSFRPLIQCYWDNTTGKLVCGFAISSGSGSSVSWTISDDTTNWYHYVVTYNGSGTWELYKNGTSLGTASGTVSAYSGSATPAFGLGCNDVGTQIFTGSFDEFGIWTRVLSSTEVSQLYNSGAGNQYPFSSGSKSPLSNLSLLGVG